MSGRKNVLDAHLSQFLAGNYTVGSSIGFADESPMVNIISFLNNQSEANWNTATNVLAAFLSKCQLVAYPSGSTYRIVATISDGTVWYDSGKTNTFAGFQGKTINDNHNTRRPFMQVLLSDVNGACESKLSSSTGKYETRVCMRVGDGNMTPLGVIGLSINA